MRRIFVDMDGVIVDFDRYMREFGFTSAEVKCLGGAYQEMEPIPGALEAVRSLIGMGFDVWLATKPPTGVAHAYADKVSWVLRHLPELKRKVIITHDKGLLGNVNDFLCDDRPHKANCELFAGKLLAFVDGYHWPQALEYFRTVRDAPREEIESIDSVLPCRFQIGEDVIADGKPGTVAGVTFAWGRITYLVTLPDGGQAITYSQFVKPAAPFIATAPVPVACSHDWEHNNYANRTICAKCGAQGLGRLSAVKP